MGDKNAPIQGPNNEHFKETIVGHLEKHPENILEPIYIDKFLTELY